MGDSRSFLKSSNGGKRKALSLSNEHKNVMPHAMGERMLPDERKAYNSYKQFNPGQYEEGSPEWQMAMIRYLLDMKNHGHKIHEVTLDKVIFSRTK